MGEWFNPPVLKTGEPRGSVGSNPTASAKFRPDFYVKELDGYLEVKGYETELDRCKWAQFNEGLTVWKKDTILTIMDRGPDGKAAGC